MHSTSSGSLGTEGQEAGAVRSGLGELTDVSRHNGAHLGAPLQPLDVILFCCWRGSIGCPQFAPKSAERRHPLGRLFVCLLFVFQSGIQAMRAGFVGYVMNAYILKQMVIQ